MITQLTEIDIVRELGEETFERGAGLWENDRVRHVDVSKDGSRISASVQGSRRQPYSQSITISLRGGLTRILGYCTCPMSINCKHVAAALLEQLYLGDDGTSHATATAEAVRAEPAALPVVLSRDITGWLDRLGHAAAAPQDSGRDGFRPNTRALLFVLNHEHAPAAASTPARIRPVKVRLRKDGGYSDPKPHDPGAILVPGWQRDASLSDTDVELLRDLAWLKRAMSEPAGADIQLTADATSLRVLETLIESGALRLGRFDGPVLQRGAPMLAEPRWIAGERGAQRLTLVPVMPAATADAATQRFDDVLPLAPPYYIDRTSLTIGRIETGLPPRLAAEVARAPAIIGSEAARVKEEMRQRLGVATAAGQAAPDAAHGATAVIPLPEAPDDVEMRKVVPRPRLELMMADARIKHSHYWYVRRDRFGEVLRLPVAHLSFDYGGEVVPVQAAAQTVERMEGERLILMPRDHKFELKAAEHLASLGLGKLSRLPLQIDAKHEHAFFLMPAEKHNISELLNELDDHTRYLTFSADELPRLSQAGWEIAFADDYPYRIAEGETQWWADVGEGTGIDWLSFELGITFEGHRINLVPHLTELLSGLPVEIAMGALMPEGEEPFMAFCRRLRSFHTLPDGRLLQLPGERLAPILRSMLELIGPRSNSVVEGKIKLHRAEAGQLARFADGTDLADLAWAASAERLIALGKSLTRGRSLEKVDPPPSFKASLRPYQSDGLAWLDFLREAQFGGVLADDMGLGKTVQALAFLSREKAEGRLEKPALIVAPTSVLPNWQAEAERFAPQLRVLALRGLERRALFGEIESHDLVLTTYPLLARDHDVLLEREFHIAILDEAQAIKNPKATVSGLAHRINARHRLALTGTPLENNLGEVWSLFQFLAPGLLGDEATFRRTFRTPIEKHGSQVAQQFLSRRLKPFMLRRTKEAVATELPPKTEIIERVRLEGGQRDLYETVRSLMHAKVRDEIAKKGLAKSHIIFLDALLKLRQICCDPRLLKMQQARKVRGSAKLDRLMEMVPELVGEGRRILLFSQFTSMLELIEPELRALKIPYVKLTGDTVDRAAPVKQFQTGKVPLFLLSLKAGGTGLNLTAADTVIHYDPWWNPAVENQATDRAYRIGQDKPVFVYKLIVEEGIEEAIELLKARKAALAEALFEGSAKSGLDLSEADISALFAPLDRAPIKRAA